MDPPTPSSKVLKVIANNLKILKSGKEVFTRDEIISAHPLIFDEKRKMFISGPAVDESGEEEKSHTHRVKKYKYLKKEVDKYFNNHRKKLLKGCRNR